ncbi:unnamed protein product [Knipowitschia caucasica]|uniref:Cell death regulator Aven n=1 Tax=Knipowitschia caucasica TaxID=637954 RepID=A0AAV2KDY6_KNICA
MESRGRTGRGDPHREEHRGRARGGHPRGKTKREHYRARGKGAGRAADFRPRACYDNEGEFPGEEYVSRSFSRRKLESNWDRYDASETQEVDQDMPSHRGADYSVLLQSAGDSFTQFRFSDEKDWDMDSFVAAQMSALVDLTALSRSLQHVPLPQRLGLQPQLVQISAPAELPPQPSLIQDTASNTTSTPSTPSAAAKALGQLHLVSPRSGAVTSQPPLNTVPSPQEGATEELEELLSLHKPETAPISHLHTERECDEVKKDVPQEEDKEEEGEEEEDAKEREDKEDKVRDIDVTQSSVKKQQLTEDDLEDWLDSMIS